MGVAKNLPCIPGWPMHFVLDRLPGEQVEAMLRTLKGTMIDTETLSLDVGALIWEIASVPFEISISKNEFETRIGEPLHILVNYDKVPVSEFNISQATVDWTDEIRREDPFWQFWKSYIYGKGSASRPFDCLVADPAEIAILLKQQVGDDPVWFRNSAFDVPRLENLFKKSGSSMPWHRRAQSDLYSLINVANQIADYEDVTADSAAHSAVEDAIAQVHKLAHVTHLVSCALADNQAQTYGLEGIYE